MKDEIQSREITMADQAEIDRLYRTYGYGDSAHAFPSIFLWKRDMGLTIWTGEEVYTVRSAWKGKNRWFFPCGSKSGKKECIERLIRSGCKGLNYLDEEDADFLETHFPGMFYIQEAEEDSEYIFDRQEMIDMPGSRYEKIRNRYRRLERDHRIEILPVGEEDMGTVQEIMRQWSRNYERGEGISDAGFTALMTENWTALNIRGVMLKLDGQAWGITAGYELDEGQYDCCAQQARENIPGVTDHLRRAFAMILPEGCRRINYEEDLGIEGLRITKTRMRPSRIKRMFSAERKG